MKSLISFLNMKLIYVKIHYNHHLKIFTKNNVYIKITVKIIKNIYLFNY